MAAEVWYRKWRPRTFAEVSGQEHAVRTLTNAVAQGRIAHAYLLCGPRGTGKTTLARLLAKAVNCAAPVEGQPCNRCESCVAVNENRALDLVEMDAASNRGIDDIRNLRDRVGYHPSAGRYRVYLIDEVHELTAQAFDALLKTLEEPPPHIIFVLATTDAHKVPATITSRCQRFDLTRVRHADIVSRLSVIAGAEGISIEPPALDVVARAAAGGLRDAVNLLEQLVASFGTAITLDQARAGLGLAGDERARDVAQAAIHGDFAAGIAALGQAVDDGVDVRQFNRAIVSHLRSLLLAAAGAGAGLDGLNADARRELEQSARGLDAAAILRALKAFSAADFRGEATAALPLELALAEITLLAGASPAPRPAEPPPAARPARPPAVLQAPVEQSPVPEPAASRPRQVSDGSRLPALQPAADDLPPPPVETPAAVAVLTLAQARSQFREIYDAVRAEHRQAGGVLNSGCDVVAVDSTAITFGFKHALMVDKFLAGTQAARVLGKAVERVLGMPLEVRCVHRPDVVDRLRASPPRTSHLLEEAQRLGGTLVESG